MVRFGSWFGPDAASHPWAGADRDVRPPDALNRSWLQDYAPEMIEVEARRYPSMRSIDNGLGGNVEVFNVPIPLHCSDGF